MGLMFRRRRPIARLATAAATAGVVHPAGRRPVSCHTHRPARYVAPPPVSTGGEVDELSRLVQMHDSSVMTDEEFAAAKAHLLRPLGTVASDDRRPPVATTRSAHGRALRGLLLATVTGESDAIGDLVTDDVIGWSPYLRVRSCAELVDVVGQNKDTFSEIEVNVRALDEVGDKAVAEWHLAVDHTGPLSVDDDLVIPPTGRRLHLSGVTVAEFDGDRICAFRSYFDDLALIEQALTTADSHTAPPEVTDHELGTDVDVHPAGGAADWLRQRLDRQPSPRVKQLAQAMLWAGLGVLLAAELIDELKASHRRLAHLASSWWAGIERRERRHIRRSGTAALASRIERRHRPRRPQG